MYTSNINDVNDELNEILNRIVSGITSNASKIRTVEKSCCKAHLNKGTISVRTYDEFLQAVDVCKVAFVLITTTVCPYCQLFKSIFAKVAKVYSDRAVFIEANADYVPEIAMVFHVYSTPTTLVLHNGKLVDTVIGYIPYNNFENYVRETLYSIGCISS
ncbi:MAG: thioredoxin family protein [Ignisphaera sp.]|uniref:Thioredoxin n=1 Tax=Ignisphaera aggregans TaxID=334771 RepID=A0A7J3MZ95_9CREN